MTQRAPLEERGDSGAALIMALVFLLALGMVISAVATLATGAFTTSINLGQERALEANAESAATLAIANIRYNYSGAWDATNNVNAPPPIIPSNGSVTPFNCMPNQTPYSGMTTYCAMSTPAPSSGASRVVQFYVCPATVAAGSIPNACAGQALFAVVTYDDLPPNASGTANICDAQGHTVTCGLGMTVDTWDVKKADN
jgi:hypothetical protein